jgi:hypothetical protein
VQTKAQRTEAQARVWHPAESPVVRGEGYVGRDFLPWLHGPARVEDGWVELDVERAEPYSPITEPDLFFDLAMLRKPAELPAFVRRYGLLRRHGAGEDAVAYRERWDDWETESRELNHALWRYRQLRRASTGDQEAIDALWEWEKESRLAAPGAPQQDSLAGVLNAVSNWLARTVNRKLESATVGLVPAGEFVGTTIAERIDTRPGLFLYDVRSRDLLSYAWVQCAKQFIRHAPMLECPECTRSFEPSDARQRYCSTRCANRAAQRRWAEKKRAQA